MEAWREPIEPAAVRARLAQPERWTILHIDVTGSSNAELAAQAAAGAPTGTVLIVEEQLAGRGRLGRRWRAPAGSSLMMSILLRPDRVPLGRRGWAGALLGLAIVGGVRQTAGIAANLKWPNDVLIGDRKCAGILAEAAGDAVVVGAGINVTLSTDELPRPAATSLLLAGNAPDRAELAAAVLDRLAELVGRWYTADGDMAASGLLTEYRRHCGTLDARVRVQLPTGETMTGTAVDITDDGALVVADAGGIQHRYSAADVVHLRPAMTGDAGHV